MASNKQKNINWSKLTQMLSFFAIIVAGVLFTVNGILSLVGGNMSLGIINTLATVALVAAVVIPGWRFTVGKKKWIKILYWVCAIILVIFGAIAFNI